MPGHVPDKWLDYTCFNRPLDRILPMKTPLKQSFNTGMSRADMDVQGLTNGLALGEEFTPQQFLERTKKMGLEVGLVIDLTNTNRYYSPQEFPHSIRYHKIFCEGHVIPSEEVYRKFSSILKDFLLSKTNKGQVAAVHCTHGVNRTGYLVCRYLIKECDRKADEAIADFGKARGHEIERDNYLDHLRKGCPPLGDQTQSESTSGTSRQSWHPHYSQERSNWTAGSAQWKATRPRDLDGRRGNGRVTRWDQGRESDRHWTSNRGSSYQPHTHTTGMRSWTPYERAGNDSWTSWSRTRTGMDSWAPQPHDYWLQTPPLLNQSLPWDPRHMRGFNSGGPPPSTR